MSLTDARKGDLARLWLRKQATKDVDKLAEIAATVGRLSQEEYEYFENGMLVKDDSEEQPEELTIAGLPAETLAESGWVLWSGFYMPTSKTYDVKVKKDGSQLEETGIKSKEKFLALMDLFGPEVPEFTNDL